MKFLLFYRKTYFSPAAFMKTYAGAMPMQQTKNANAPVVLPVPTNSSNASQMATILILSRAEPTYPAVRSSVFV